MKQNIKQWLILCLFCKHWPFCTKAEVLWEKVYIIDYIIQYIIYDNIYKIIHI